MIAMRPIHKVAQAIKTLIPDDYEKRADLVFELDDIIESSSYAAPELTIMMWDRLCETLEMIGTPSAKWQTDIQDLMSTKLDYRSVLGE